MDKIKTIQLDEEKGEMVCSKCNGIGYFEEDIMGMICNKCHGHGKLDWIENIVGKARPIIRPKVYGMQSVQWEQEYDSVFDNHISVGAKQIADTIDKDIINTIIKKSRE